MDAFEVVDDGTDRESWLKARTQGIGGSDAAEVCGVNSYGSAMHVYESKVNAESEDRAGKHARLGLHLEPYVLELFEEETGRSLRRSAKLLRSRARPWQLCTLDATQWKNGSHLGNRGLLEIKVSKFEIARIPLDMWCQIQHQFSVTGLEWGSIAVYNLSRCELDFTDIEPDQGYIEQVNEMEAKFWADTMQGIPPQSDGSDSCAEALKRLYPDHVPGKEIKLEGTDWTNGAQNLSQNKELRKGLTDRCLKFENKIKAAMGDAESVVLDDGTVYTYRTQSRKETIQKASTFRVLRVQEAK